LDVEWNLSAVDRAIVAEANFDGKVEASIVVGMSVEGDGSGKRSV
jgi:hypothetical protein